MRYTELICFSVILALFSSLFASSFYQILKLDKKEKELKARFDSLIFISESFYNSCLGKGFSSFEEWEKGCSSLWKLERIEWEKTGDGNKDLYCGRWEDSSGICEVYARKKEGRKK